MLERSISFIGNDSGSFQFESSFPQPPPPVAVNRSSSSAGGSNDGVATITTTSRTTTTTAEEEIADDALDVLLNNNNNNNNNNSDDNRPPVDDVCPICFGTFTLPAKTNCGHWFCGGCILQFWAYKRTLQKCKCPICCSLISMLTPEECLLNRQEKEVIEVVENLNRYNGLQQGGLRGLLQNFLALPLLAKRMFQGLLDPDRFRVNYYTARVVGVFLGMMYQISPFDFIPTGGFPAPRLFEYFAICLVVVLTLVGICNRAFEQMRMRRLAAGQVNFM